METIHKRMTVSFMTVLHFYLFTTLLPWFRMNVLNTLSFIAFRIIELEIQTFDLSIEIFFFKFFHTYNSAMIELRVWWNSVKIFVKVNLCFLTASSIE